MAFKLIFAKKAFSAGDVERDDHTIAFLYLGHAGAYLFYDPHRFMPDDIVLLKIRDHPVNKVKV
ncbi:hypothetical protein D3C85_1873730 [compost metagenome]